MLTVDCGPLIWKWTLDREFGPAYSSFLSTTFSWNLHFFLKQSISYFGEECLRLTFFLLILFFFFSSNDALIHFNLPYQFAKSIFKMNVFFWALLVSLGSLLNIYFLFLIGTKIIKISALWNQTNLLTVLRSSHIPPILCSQNPYTCSSGLLPYYN